MPGGPELAIHLGVSGRIVVTAPDGTVTEGGDQQRYDARPGSAKWSRFTLTFADGGSLVLLDPRRLGRVWLSPDMGALGPDATKVTPAQFRALITKGTIAVKARLLDQSKIAGVGNLLADEILWQARVSPLARVDSLSPAQVTRLYCALKSVLESAIAKGGARTGEIIAARHLGGTCPRYPQPGFSRASRRTRNLMLPRVAGRPVLPRLDGAAQRRRTMSRCQRRIVSGVTSSRSPWRRAFGITPSSWVPAPGPAMCGPRSSAR